MSGSSAFANYSNTSQQLSDSISQLKPTSTQITNDKANFEQQFLIGAALAAKMKATDKFVGLFKKSKAISSLKDKTEGEIRNLAESAQSRANEVANNLVNKIKGVKPTDAPPQPPPPVNPSTSPDDLDTLKDLADTANKKVADTSKALENAENEMIDSRDAVKDAYETRDAYQAIVESNSARAVSQAGSTIRQSQQIADATARKTLNDARNQIESQEERARVAEQSRNDLAEQLEQHQNTAEEAAKDVARASSEEADASEASAVASKAAEAEKIASGVEKTAADSEKAIKVTKDLEDGEKALKVTSDIEKASAETSEADPLGLIVTAIAAVATQIIGRKIKAHENLVSAPVPPTTFSSTLGA